MSISIRNKQSSISRDASFRTNDMFSRFPEEVTLRILTFVIGPENPIEYGHYEQRTYEPIVPKLFTYVRRCHCPHLTDIPSIFTVSQQFARLAKDICRHRTVCISSSDWDTDTSISLRHCKTVRTSGSQKVLRLSSCMSLCYASKISIRLNSVPHIEHPVLLQLASVIHRSPCLTRVEIKTASTGCALDNFYMTQLRQLYLDDLCNTLRSSKQCSYKKLDWVLPNEPLSDDVSSSEFMRYLKLASLIGSVAVVRDLLHKADMDTVYSWYKLTNDLRTSPRELVGAALHLACEEGNLQVVRAIFGTDKADVNYACRDGNTLLMRAYRNDHEDVVKLLLRHPDINQKSVSAIIETRKANVKYDCYDNNTFMRAYRWRG